MDHECYVQAKPSAKFEPLQPFMDISGNPNPAWPCSTCGMSRTPRIESTDWCISKMAKCGTSFAQCHTSITFSFNLIHVVLTWESVVELLVAIRSTRVQYTWSIFTIISPGRSCHMATTQDTTPLKHTNNHICK